MLRIFLKAIALAGLVAANTAQWTAQTSGVSARLRGVSAVSDQVAWSSGAKATILRTADGGRSWQQLSIPDAAALDFRDIDAVSEDVAYVLSIGPGDASRIYKTTDAGAHWTLQFTNTDPKAFFDAMGFWDARRGVAVSDSVDGQFVIMTTGDGAAWTRVPAAGLPVALPNEAAFAASGTNVAVLPPNHVWIGTGGASRSRVLRSSDGGRTWSVSDTPLASSESAGIFSVAFRDARHGIVVGSDYKREGDALNNAAITDDGGVTWKAVSGIGGFRSVVAYVPESKTPTLVAAGPLGADLSTDGGRTWTPIAGPGVHAFSFAPTGRIGWGVGEAGRIASLTGW